MVLRTGLHALRAAARAAVRPRAVDKPAAGVRHASSGKGNLGTNGHYNEPTGFLFGERPPPPGQSREKEAWERPWFYGMFGGMLFGGIWHYYRPDDRIDTIYEPLARQRLTEKYGDDWKYKPSIYSGWYRGSNPRQPMGGSVLPTERSWWYRGPLMQEVSPETDFRYQYANDGEELKDGQPAAKGGH